jgi:hypothetical protein
MSNLDDQLNRLLKAGATRERPNEATLPIGFASRVFSEWRVAKAEGEDLSCTILCKRAVLCSYGVAALLLVFNLRTLESFRGFDAWHAEDVRLIKTAMQPQMP